MARGMEGLGSSLITEAPFNVNEAHCHPHITPDGQHVLYTSDTSGYGNLYLVEIGEPSELPELALERR